jgi:protein subunit release factor B
MPISVEKQNALHARMISLGILEQDIEETFVRSSGAGGQHVNKTASCVQLIHRPTGILVKCQQDRSQAVNRFLARRILMDRIESQRLGKLSAEQQAREKIRRQKRRRSRRAKEKMLAQKHHRSQILQNRHVSHDE